MDLANFLPEQKAQGLWNPSPVSIWMRLKQLIFFKQAEYVLVLEDSQILLTLRL